MIKITATIRGRPFAQTLRERLHGPAFESFLKEVQTDMVEQVRRNVVSMGGPGGRWPQLSGFNGNRGSMEHQNAKQRIRDVTRGFGTAKDLEELGSARKHLRTVVAHSGYARWKAEQQAAGHLKFGAAERLRATGGLVAALVARVTRFAYKTVIALTAEGTAPNGTPYDVILRAHSEGTATIPQRNPTANMEQFEKRVGVRLRRLLSGR